MILFIFGIHIMDEQLPKCKKTLILGPNLIYIHDVLLHSNAWVTNMNKMQKTLIVWMGKDLLWEQILAHVQSKWIFFSMQPF